MWIGKWRKRDHLGFSKGMQVRFQVTQGREKGNKGTGESVFIRVPRNDLHGFTNYEHAGPCPLGSGAAHWTAVGIMEKWLRFAGSGIGYHLAI